MIKILTCKVGEKTINCYDGTYNKEQLKKWADKNILLCPICNKPYEYCHGKVKIPYFRHKDKEECLDKYSESETNEHLNGKIQLYEWIKKQNGVTDTVLEGWIRETKQRPDIMFKYNGEQYVIEYQCTPIATEYYERHELYELARVKDIWICGTDKYFQCYHEESGKTGNKKVSEIEKNSCIYYDYKSKIFYIIDNKMEEKEFKYNIKRNKDNYYLVKNEILSYYSKSYYPSGKPSNKYPYPLKKYEFDINVSLAQCISMKDYKFEG